MEEGKNQQINGQCIQEELIKDYITGKFIKETPEEIIRQIFEKKLVKEYGYPINNIETNFLLRQGTKKLGIADIAVFKNEERNPENLYIIIETRRSERIKGLEQLKSFLGLTTADYGVWFNGKEIVYLQCQNKTPCFLEIPDIPKQGEGLADIGLYQKKDLKPAIELKTVFETCHNYIYANEGLLKERVFNEFFRLVFMKMVDEKSARENCDFRITHKELEEMEQAKGNIFFDRIIGLFDRVKKEYPDVFNEYEKLTLKPMTIAFVVSQLQKYSLMNTSVEVKGTAFQTFVGAHQRGDRGEFFTPYPVLELVVGILNPTTNDSILDPACGSGGFLIQSMKQVWSIIDDNQRDVKNRRRKEFKIQYARKNIRGIDINPDLAKVSKMQMILFDDGYSGIFSANSLESFDYLETVATAAGAGSIHPESFRIVVTNPPFSGKGQVTDKKILAQFELGHKWEVVDGEWRATSNLKEGQTPEVLFIERCLQFLEFGGRLAIVIPDTILTSSSHDYVREFIKKHSKVLGIVSLPHETFMPFSAIKTTLLFLEKQSKEYLSSIGDYNVFSIICEKIGYDRRGKPIYQHNDLGELILDRDNNPIIDTDIPEIIDSYKNYLREVGK